EPMRRKIFVISIAVLLISTILVTFNFSTINEAAPLGPEFRVNTYTTFDQEYPSVAMDSTGNFIITWQRLQDADYMGIFAQRYDSDGNPVGNEFLVNTYQTDDQLHPSIAMNDTGYFVIVWQSDGQDGDGFGIYAQRFDNTGSALGSEFRVNNYTSWAQEFPSVAMDSAGNFVIAWQSNWQDGSDYGIYAMRYDSNGNELAPPPTVLKGGESGNEFRVNNYTILDQRYPSVAMDPVGNFIIAWSSYGQDGDMYGAFTQRFDNNGNELAPPPAAKKGGGQGNEFRANTYASSNQVVTSLKLNDTGYFVITWSSYGQDGSNNGVYAQRYDYSGNLLGTEFLVNTNTLGAQERSSIAMDPQGNFVITWHSNGQDGDFNGIYAQQFDNSGNPLGSEFQVNIYWESLQEYPSIAMDSAGNYVITWHSFGQDGWGYGIYARRYDSKVLLLVSEVQAGDITDIGATIAWKTNYLSNSTVEYGFTTAYGSVVEYSSNVTQHSVDLTGLEPGRLYHFRISSYFNSTIYNISSDFTFTTKFPIDLEPGWNMISVPLIQGDTALQIVLENISVDYDAVQCYNSSDNNDPWKHHRTTKPQSLNDLSEINRFKGLWIHMKNAATLYVNGTAPEIGYFNQITLYNGWNFAGYPSLIERVPASSGLPAGVDMVQWYNASSGSWEYWDPGASPDTLDFLKPGQGLWIHHTGISDVWPLEYVS
ncbi:MAG: fibronectin type III domain-containing protein, partial [Methanomassiliicoccales archaeon]